MTPQESQDQREKRDRLCKKLGLGNVNLAYQMVTEGARKGPDVLTKKGVKSQTLIELGYTAMALRKLGYSEASLESLGFEVAKPKATAPPGSADAVSSVDKGPVAGAGRGSSTDQLKTLIDAGMRAEQLHAQGYNALICRKAGYSASHLNSIGFSLHELKGAYPLAELRRAGFSAMDLKRYFSGHEFKQAGFPATEMRMAGFTVKQLIGFGYPENMIVTAGFTIVDLTDAGLSRRTVDRKGFH